VVSGISAVVAVGAPTSLALSVAQEAGLVLVGFTRGQRCVVYAGANRVTT
jgi:FdhD protein